MDVEQVSSLCLIIPTLNPMPTWDKVMVSLSQQTLKPKISVMIDSSSVDGAREVARKHGMIVEVIDETAFNHGGTRRYAFEKYCSDCEVVVFLTQDSILASSDSIEKIVVPFSDPSVGAVYGRQLPRAGAEPIEAHSRYFNYPPESVRKRFKDAEKYGIKAAYFSNAWGAYRTSVLKAVGGFPESAICSEDSYVAAKVLAAGYDIVYAGDALTWHSHDMTIAQEFKRYFDLGVFHAQESWLLGMFGSANSEGWRYVQSELAYLLKRSPLSIPEAALRSVAKISAYRLGRHYEHLPRAIVRKLSSHQNFWLSN